MHKALVALLALLLAGCASPSTTDPTHAGSTAAPVEAAKPAGDAKAATPPPILITGTVTTIVGCGSPATGYSQNDKQPVPKEAGGRAYDGPVVTGGTVNGPGSLCATWLDGDGKQLTASGKVPQGAASVVVMASAHVQAQYRITIK